MWCTLVVTSSSRASTVGAAGQGDVLVDLIRVMIEENELVVSYRTIADRHSPSVSIDPESMEPIRKHYNYVRHSNTHRTHTHTHTHTTHDL